MNDTLTHYEEELLLGRAVEPLLRPADRKAFTGRACLITGAGGTVGSELSRQIAACSPSLLVLLDHSEHALFQIEHELRERWPTVAIEPVLGDVTRATTIGRVMRRLRPDLVFHAAAYKHVTMAERAICAAARVNVLGTCAVLAFARDVGAQFVLISSDKAASPRSVMGATKRFAELASLAVSRDDVAGPLVVRFGNILASSGSFVEVMRDRIRAGRPLLVTDPDATRFFMTVTEAASLVMKASIIARGGETFWLDMGEPVRIGELVERMLAAAARSGLPPVPVNIIGLRPGEKLVEQLTSQGISMRPTASPRIWVARQAPVAPRLCAEWLRQLRRSVAKDDALAVIEVLTAAVRDFEPSEQAWAIARQGKPWAIPGRRGERLPGRLSA
jgi:FlaA1/EpsC-like NDP-sugar epimerase